MNEIGLSRKRGVVSAVHISSAIASYARMSINEFKNIPNNHNIDIELLVYKCFIDLSLFFDPSTDKVFSCSNSALRDFNVVLFLFLFCILLKRPYCKWSVKSGTQTKCKHVDLIVIIIIIPPY